MIPLSAILAAIPLLLRLIAWVTPASVWEPYTYWSPATLNDKTVDGRLPAWRNMGWWEGTESFTEANEALARKLVTFAKAPKNGNVLDLAHGTGESLLIHLESRPAHLHALTSLPSESAQAQALVAGKEGTTAVEWFTSSAAYIPGKDLGHPLNPMRGMQGEKGRRDGDRDHDEDAADALADAVVAEHERNEVPYEVEPAHTDAERAAAAAHASPAPPPYDLVYILDAVYHFPPSVPDFLSAVLPVVRAGSGVVAFTDVLPPPDLPLWQQVVLPRLVAVPQLNVARRPHSIEHYKLMMEKVGYEHVSVEDWTAGVFPGIQAYLERRGGVWAWVAKAFGKAEQNGWKYIAVRAERPATSRE